MTSSVMERPKERPEDRSGKRSARSRGAGASGVLREYYVTNYWPMPSSSISNVSVLFGGIGPTARSP